MNEIIVGILFGSVLLLVICVCCNLAGYKRGIQDMAKFHNSVRKTAEREALKDGSTSD